MKTKWTTGQVATLCNRNTVSHNCINANKGNISYVLSSGEFIVIETGFYLVYWWVATDVEE